MASFLKIFVVDTFNRLDCFELNLESMYSLQRRCDVFLRIFIPTRFKIVAIICPFLVKVKRLDQLS